MNSENVFDENAFIDLKVKHGGGGGLILWIYLMICQSAQEGESGEGKYLLLDVWPVKIIIIKNFKILLWPENKYKYL